MKAGNRFVALAALLAAFVLTACEGNSGSSNSLAPYLGRWVGSYVSTPVGTTNTVPGTADITVMTNGDFMGVVVNTATQETATMSGEVDVDDDVIYVTGTIVSSGTALNPVAGTLRLEAGHLVGSIHTYSTQRVLINTAVVDLQHP